MARIPYEYYDNQTRELLNNTLTDEDIKYIEITDETIEKILFRRWNTIINSLSSSHYDQYYSQMTPDDRNHWFQEYLNYPTKNILYMPKKL